MSRSTTTRRIRSSSPPPAPTSVTSTSSRCPEVPDSTPDRGLSPRSGWLSLEFPFPGNPMLPLRRTLTLIIFALSAVMGAASDAGEPHQANPILPGYYADPSLVQFEGKSYLYA